MAARRDGTRDVSQAVGAAVDAVITKLEAPGKVRAAVWSLKHDHQMSIPQITRALYDGLRERGLSADQIDGAGVSHDRIRQLVQGDRP